MSTVVKIPTRRGGTAAPVDKIQPIDDMLDDYAGVERKWAAELRGLLEAGPFLDNDQGNGPFVPVHADDLRRLVDQMDATARNLAGFADWLRHNWPSDRR